MSVMLAALVAFVLIGLFGARFRTRQQAAVIAAAAILTVLFAVFPDLM